MASMTESMASPAFKPPPAPASPTSHLTPSLNFNIRSLGSVWPPIIWRMSSSASPALGVASARLMRKVPPIIGGRGAPSGIAEGRLFAFPGTAAGGLGRLTISHSDGIPVQGMYSHPIPRGQSFGRSIQVGK
jgi:hypothetical protein